MTDRKTPEEISETDLDQAQGGTHTPEWKNLNDSDPGGSQNSTDATRGVWKAPAGLEARLTHDPVFEERMKKR